MLPKAPWPQTSGNTITFGFPQFFLTCTEACLLAQDLQKWSHQIGCFQFLHNPDMWLRSASAEMALNFRTIFQNNLPFAALSRYGKSME